MSIELVYGFAEPNESSHIVEEELIVDYGINLYSLEISNGIACKAFYGIQVNLDSKILFGSKLTIGSDIMKYLKQDDLESIDNLYNKIYENYSKNVDDRRLQIVYSTAFPFNSKPYSLRKITNEYKVSEEKDKNVDPLEQIMKQARAHIEEQVESQKKVIEYLKSIQEKSRYKFELIHNLPSKNFLSTGKITPEYNLKIYDESELVYHVKLQISGIYDQANGFDGQVDLINVITNKFEPDDEFLSELESWAYLYDDGTIFQEISEHLISHLRDLVKE